MNAPVERQGYGMTGPTERFYNPGRNFYFEAPADWLHLHVLDHMNIVQAVRPDRKVSVTATGLLGPEGVDLADFAEKRFEARDEWLHPVEEVRQLKNGVYRAFAGVDPSDGEAMFWVIGAVQIAPRTFVSFSVIAQQDDFEHNRALYEDIMESPRLND